MPWVYRLQLKLQGRTGVCIDIDRLWTNLWPTSSPIIRVRQTEAGIGKNGFGGKPIRNELLFTTPGEAEASAAKIAAECIKSLKIWVR